MTKIRSYQELSRIESFEDRFEYLKLGGEVGKATFGFDRYVNQGFYKSREWRQARDFVIIRDNGCDLGVLGFEIHDAVLVHHINPMVLSDLVEGEDWITNPDYLITTTKETHNAIHFGDRGLLRKDFVPRRPGDTRLW